MTEVYAATLYPPPGGSDPREAIPVNVLAESAEDAVAFLLAKFDNNPRQFEGWDFDVRTRPVNTLEA